MNFFNLRIFWACRVTSGADGYYYHTWYNWIRNKTEVVFAGYTRRVLVKESTSFATVIARLKDGEKSKSMVNGKLQKR